MKRYGYKEIVDNINAHSLAIKVNTMPFSIPGKPDIALIGFDDSAAEIILGSVSSPTFYKLLDNHIIARQKNCYSCEYYW
jgi:hypothetical protein|nr:MAG TPA: hypothetical protein [Inoviridae sp.]